jgi:hypothetical protein
VDVLKFLGFPATCPTGEVFAQAVADWQDRHKPLTPDGIIGPNTWKKMEPEMRKSPGLIPPPPLPPAGGGPPWLQYAQAEGICWGMKIISWGKDKKRFTAEEHLTGPCRGRSAPTGAPRSPTGACTGPGTVTPAAPGPGRS